LTTGALGLIEIVLVFGLVLGFAIWQWVSVRREIKRDHAERERAETSPAPARSPDEPPA
jgi:hypothetical protein